MDNFLILCDIIDQELSLPLSHEVCESVNLLLLCQLFINYSLRFRGLSKDFVKVLCKFLIDLD